MTLTLIRNRYQLRPTLLGSLGKSLLYSVAKKWILLGLTYEIAALSRPDILEDLACNTLWKRDYISDKSDFFLVKRLKKLFKYSFKGNPFRKEPGTVFIQEDETWKAALQTRAKREKRAPQNLGFKDFFSKGLLIVPSFLKHWVHLTFKISDFTLSKSVSLFSKIALFGIPKVIQGHCCI